MDAKQMDIIRSLQGDTEDMSQKMAMLTGNVNTNHAISRIIDSISHIQDDLNLIIMETKRECR
jgi:hypothetical protein